MVFGCWSAEEEEQIRQKSRATLLQFAKIVVTNGLYERKSPSSLEGLFYVVVFADLMLFVIRDCQLDDERHIVGLVFGSQRRLVSAYLAALAATVDYNEALFGVGLGAYGLKLAAARVGAVPRVYVDVKRPQAKRAMVSRRISERLDRASAMHAHKRVVVFCKSFLLHRIPRLKGR